MGGGEEQIEQRHAGRGGEAAESIERLPFDGEPGRPAGRRLDAWSHFSPREGSLQGHAGKFLLPEAAMSFEVGRIMSPRHDREAPAVDRAVGGVRCGQVPVEDPDRPLIDDRMVKRQHQRRLGPGHVEAHRPEEWRDGQIEGR